MGAIGRWYKVREGGRVCKIGRSQRREAQERGSTEREDAREGRNTN